MRFLILIIGFYFVTLKVIAQDFNKDFEEQNHCSIVKRLDRKGGPLENHPIQDQGSLSTCYANVSSIVFLTKLKKLNPKLKVDQLSWIYLAYLRKKDYFEKLQDDLSSPITNLSKAVLGTGGYMCDIFESVKGKNVCAIGTTYWDKNLFKNSLEGNSQTLYNALNDYSDFLQSDDIFEDFAHIKQILNPNCFTYLDTKVDGFIKQNFNKLINSQSFESVWGQLAEPKIENLKRFKQIIVNRYIKNNLQLEGNSSEGIYTSSKLLKEGFADGYYSLTDEDRLSLQGVLLPPHFVNNEFSNHYYQTFSNFNDEFVKSAGLILKPLQDELKNDLISCIDQVLNRSNPFENQIFNSCEKLQNENESKKIADFVSKMLGKNFNPKHIMMLVNDRNISSKLTILESFMNSFYQDCNIRIPEDWDCGYIWPEDLDKNYPDKNHGEVVMKIASEMIEKNEALYLALDNDFFKSDESLRIRNEQIKTEIEELNKKKSIQVLTKDDEEKLQKLENFNPGTHAVSIIGYAQNCGSQKQCILIQNSFGESTIYEEDAKASTPPYIIPDRVTLESYTDDTGKIETYRNYSYGKFWVCDPDKIKRYFNNLSGFN